MSETLTLVTTLKDDVWKVIAASETYNRPLHVIYERLIEIEESIINGGDGKP